PSGTPIGRPVLIDGPSRALALNADGSLLALADGGIPPRGERPRPGDVFLHDSATGKRIRKVGTLTDFINVLAFSPDGKRLAATGDDPPTRGAAVPPKLTVWELDGKLHFQARTANPWNHALAFSPDGKRLLVGDTVGASLWDLARKAPYARLI